MDKVKITNNQFFSLTANFAIGGSIVIVPSLIAGVAKQDAWISALITPVFGLPVIWLWCFLCSKYPDMTFVEIIIKILGKWVGRVTAASFILLCLINSMQMPWYVTIFIKVVAMPETPAYVLDAVFVACTVIALLYGVETFARASELFIRFASFLFISVMILVLPNVRIENILPVFEKGFAGTLKGTFFLSAFQTLPLITLMMIYPVNAGYLNLARKSIFKGYLWAGLLNFICILMDLLVLGTVVTANSQYPTYLLSKEINVGVIFTRFEFVVALIWFITFLFVFIFFFYSTVIGLSQLLGLKDYRKTVLPLGLIILVMSEVVYPNVAYQANFDSLATPLYWISYGLILPIILLIVYWVKKWVSK